MKDAWRGVALLALSAALLAGCQSAEDRITEAFQVGKDVEAAKMAFDKAIEGLPSERKKALEANYASQLKLRALECGKGFQPGTFDGAETIRKAIGDGDCFVQADVGLRSWLGLQRVGLLIGMPPLRPVPAKAAAGLAASDVISSAAFADAAGVALLQVGARDELIDLNDGKVLRVGEHGNGSSVKLSPNGRVVVRVRQGGIGLQDAETGEDVATLADAAYLHFAGDRGLVYSSKHKPTFHDFVSGSDVPLPFQQFALAALIPVPNKAGDFVLLGDNRAALLSLACQDSGCSPRLVMEGRMPGIGGWAQRMAVLGDNAYFFAGKNLVELQLATLQTRSISFDPLFLTDVIRAHAPDALLLGVGSMMGGRTFFLYAPKAGTLAKVDAEQLPSNRLAYAASLQGIVAMDGARLVPVERIAASAPEALSSVLSAMQFDAQVAKLEMFDRLAAARAMRGEQASSIYARPAREMASTSRTFPPGAAGLAEAVRAGVMRAGNDGDLATWKRAYQSGTGKALGSAFDERVRMMQVYVVTGDLTIPSGLSGANAVVFVLKSGTPYPRGDAGHSLVLDAKTGGCGGALCGMILR